MSKATERTEKSTPTLQKVLAVIIGLGCAIALWRLLSLLIFEINPLHHGGDGLIYTTVGRGITQGLVPYKDLFEYKPPGMFLIVAVSLMLTKGMMLANVLQGATELGIVILVQIFAWRSIRHESRKLQRWNLLGSTFIFSVLLLLQLADKAGHFQSESIGTFFILLFALLVTRKKDMSFSIAIIASLTLMVAIGIKEPFVFTGFCVLLLLLPFRQTLKMYAMTLGIAIIVGVILMALLGYLQPYLTIYLPELLGPRLNYWKDPWWSNGFYVPWIIIDIWSFSPFLFVALLASFIGTMLYHADFDDWRDEKVLILFAVVTSILWSIINTMITRHSAMYDEINSLAPTIAVVTAVFVSVIVFTYRKFHPYTYIQGCRALLKTFGGIFLVAVTVSLGGHLPQQFGFATSFYYILFLSSLAGALSMQSQIQRGLFSIAVVASFVGILSPLPHQNYSEMMRDRTTFNTQQEKSAQTIDDIMDACHFDRYVIIGEPPVPWGFTKHTPYGPAFSRSSFTYPVEWRDPPIAYLQDTYFENLTKASILITPKRDSVLVDLADVPQNIVREFAEHFAIDPPDCAKIFTDRMKAENFLFFFRKNQLEKLPTK